jgi:hypothetical protein
MREICSYGSVGERGGNEPLYPEVNSEPERLEHLLEEFDY